MHPDYTDHWQRLGISEAVIQQRELPFFDEPEALVEVSVTANGRIHQLEPNAATAWLAMQQAAAEDAVTMYLISGFRSISRQAELIEEKLKQGKPISEILSVLAPPGCSEHHSGQAVDIGAPGFGGLDEGFEKSPAFGWLEEHASRFGFSLSFPRENRWGYQYEPWHWRYR